MESYFLCVVHTMIILGYPFFIRKPEIFWCRDNQKYERINFDILERKMDYIIHLISQNHAVNVFVSNPLLLL